MQAGREIMVYADPAKIPDNQLQELIATIGKKIETKLDYPGVIRCVCFRENKMVQYLR
jgi:HD superfamily phosphodiesterase